VIAEARVHGLGVGVSLKPGTAVEEAVAAAEGADLILLMSIEPGYSGQEFMPEALPRLRRLRELVGEEFLLQVDGGVGSENVRELRDAGARLFVAGASVFGHGDPGAAYRALASAVA
jgi:ribulose-phosphate 3-epimerase